MKLIDFINENREQLETAIKETYGQNAWDESEGDIEEFIYNDEGLYVWAMQNGVYDI